MSEQSPDIGALAAALAAVQAELEPVAKTSTAKIGDKYNYKYADLTCVLAAALPTLSKHGLSIIQTTAEAEAGIVVVTTLAHASGQWIRGRLAIRCSNSDAKAIGSAITYARRYAVSAIIGLSSEEDDDGAASEIGRSRRALEQERRPALREGGVRERPAAAGSWRDIIADSRIDDSPAFAFLDPGLRGRKIGEATDEILAAGAAAHFDEISRDEAKTVAERLKSQLAVYHCAKRITSGKSPSAPSAGTKTRPQTAPAEGAAA